MPKKKKKNYFPNKEVEKKILIWQKNRVFLNFADILNFITGKNKYVKLKKENDILITEIMYEIKNIIKAIIMLYRFYRFESYDELEQEGWANCFANVKKFNPEKGMAFNFFSLITKKSLLALTYKEKKYRTNTDISGIFIPELLEGEEDRIFIKDGIDIDFFCEEIQFHTNHFLVEDDEITEDDIIKINEVVDVFIDFLKKNQNFLLKDFRATLKEKGIKYTSFTKFKKMMKRNIYKINLNKEK